MFCMEAMACEFAVPAAERRCAEKEYAIGGGLGAGYVEGRSGESKKGNLVLSRAEQSEI